MIQVEEVVEFDTNHLSKKLTSNYYKNNNLLTCLKIGYLIV